MVACLLTDIWTKQEGRRVVEMRGKGRKEEDQCKGEGGGGRRLLSWMWMPSEVVNHHHAAHPHSGMQVLLAPD